MIDSDNIIPTPKWMKELEQQIAKEYNLEMLDVICIIGEILTAIRKNTSKSIIFWIARDNEDHVRRLWLFTDKPQLNVIGSWWSRSKSFNIPNDLFPQITFENSPKRIELKILEDE
jgi:hypothetical protein